MSSSSTHKDERSAGPAIHDIGTLQPPEWQATTLPNGTRMVEVSMGTQELVSLEIIHFASRGQEDIAGASRATARLLREGTKQLSSQSIAQQVDYYGASMSTGANLDFSFIKLFTLRKYFDDLLPIIKQVRYEPTFPQAELDRYVKNNIQKLAMDESKVELRAYKAVTEAIFGESHPYGYNTTQAMYEALTRKDLVQHHQRYYGSDNCLIVLSGMVDSDLRKAVIEAFGTVQQHVPSKPYPQPQPIPTPATISLPASDKSQTGIKIGLKLWDRSHPDFASIFVLNTVLGGYFGSRLMSTIREEKGYTYSIYSGLDMLRHDGYFFVSTEVANEYVEDTIATIYQEIEKLKNELIPDEELQMIKNYLRGNFLNMVDGPFKVAGLVKLMEINELPATFFTGLSQYVNDIEASEVRRIAQQYLHRSQMVEVIVGGQVS